MKKLAIFFLSLSLFSFNEYSTNTYKDKFVLKGDIKGYGNGEVIISYSDPNEKIKPDTLKVINDKFKMTGALKSPRMSFLKLMHNNRLEQEYFRIDFIMENSEMMLEASIDNLKDYKLTGSNAAIGYKKIASEGNEILKDIRESETAYTKAPENSEEKLKLEEWLNVKREAYLSFLSSQEKFSSSHAAAYSLWLFSVRLPWQRLKEVISMFDKSLDSNVYLKYMKRKVEGAERIQPSSPAYNFHVSDLSGKDYTLESFKGNYLLIFFSASWCVPCKYEYPYMRTAYKDYSDKGLKVITLNLDEDREKWDEDVKKANFPWPVLSDLNAFSGELTKNYGVLSIPKIFLIDPAGKIVSNNIRGENILKELEKIYGKP